MIKSPIKSCSTAQSSSQPATFASIATIAASKDARRGSALLVVLVVIALLTLSAYTFTELMVTEYHAATVYGRQSQSQAWAESGVSYVAALLGPDGGSDLANLYQNPAMFEVAIAERGGFAILTPNEPGRDGSNLVTFRQGLSDESGKINLNALAKLSSEDGLAREILMALPGMTEAIADSILDWIDEDDVAREYGMESADYSNVIPRNGPLQSLEELLLIEDVTPTLLYGEDTNRNGMLDPNEDDGDKTLPWDNADGVLDLGWSQYLTLHGRESNLRRTPEYFGESKINLNQELLTDLYDELEDAHGAEIATFIVAFRLGDNATKSSSPEQDTGGAGGSGAGGASGGASGGGSSPPQGGGASGGSSGSGSGGNSGGSGSGSGQSGGSSSSGASSGSGSGSSSGAGGASGGSSSGTGGASGGSSAGGGERTGLWRPSMSSQASASSLSTGNAETDSALRDAAEGLANVLSGGAGTVTRGGMDLSGGSGRLVNSLYELMGTELDVNIDGQLSKLSSPWASDPGSLQSELGLILDQFTITNDTEILGRININEAPLQVLQAIPGMPEDVPEKILAHREQRLQAGNNDERFNTAGWLLIEGIVDQETMAILDQSVTARGTVYRFQSVGYSDRGGPVSRVEAMIDATSYAPKIIMQRDLSGLGIGFSRSQLPTFEGVAKP